MTRLTTLKREDMQGEQAKVYDEIAAQNGLLGGPYTAYIRIPKFMRLNHEIGRYLRANSVSAQLRHVIVLTVVRFWRSKFAWAVNVRNALEVGVTQSVIDAINEGRQDAITEPDFRKAYELTVELLNSKQLSDKNYADALAHFGEERLVDIIATIGFYCSVALTLIAFEVTPPAHLPHKLAE